MITVRTPSSFTAESSKQRHERAGVAAIAGTVREASKRPPRPAAVIGTIGARRGRSSERAASAIATAVSASGVMNEELRRAGVGGDALQRWRENARDRKRCVREHVDGMLGAARLRSILVLPRGLLAGRRPRVAARIVVQEPEV